MSTKPPHHVSSQEFPISGLFRISSFGFRISPDLSGRIMQNEPNLTSPTPKNAKRTQSPPLASPIRRNEPNHRRWQAQSCETNPISTLRTSSQWVAAFCAAKGWFPQPQNTQNEPNFHPAHDPILRNEPNLVPLPPQNPQNEPNSRTPGVQPPPISPKRTQSQPGPQPKYAKQTQFTVAHALRTVKKTETNPISSRCRPKMRKTNPISTPRQLPAPPITRNEPNLPRTRPTDNPNTRNEPNSRIPSVPLSHIYAKRTQSRPRNLPVMSMLLPI